MASNPGNRQPRAADIEMPHVLVAGRIHASGVALLKSTSGFSCDLVDEVSIESYVRLIGKADALLLRTQPLTAEILAKAPQLKIVSRHGVGYDAVDMAALTARQISLAIVGDVNSRSVAEHTLMLMLSVARRVVANDAASRTGNWNERNSFSSVELDGKQLLLFGFGRIGKAVARLAQAFGMRVAAHDPNVPEEAMAAAGVQYVGAARDGLKEADFLSVHMPAVSGAAIIGKEQLALMKPSAILINTARGGLIDELALDAALRAGQVAGAGLDVLVEEPPLPGHPLLSNMKVTISPHAAGLTRECAERMSIMSVQNIIDFFGGTANPALIVNAREVGVRQP
jgi:D-3-phosphoglycerate dehydrogenase / 2-oxoglutarate reductase